MEEQILWLVAHFDTHGTGGIVKDGLTEEEAKKIQEEFERRPHHQHYVVLSYSQGKRAEVLESAGILQ